MRLVMGWMLCGVVLALGATTKVSSAAEHQLTGDNTKIEFVGTKKDGKHSGSFPKLTGTFEISEDAAKNKITVNIETDGLESDDAKLTGHLKSPDFFEVKKFPEAKFVSTGIKAEKEGFTVTGDLTLRGKTKSIKFPAKIENKNGTATLNADFKIKRSDWGMTYGAGMIDDDVKLTVSVKAK